MKHLLAHQNLDGPKADALQCPIVLRRRSEGASLKIPSLAMHISHLTQECSNLRQLCSGLLSNNNLYGRPVGFCRSIAIPITWTILRLTILKQDPGIQIDRVLPREGVGRQ